MATIGKYSDVPVYSGKMSCYSAIFRHDIPRYSGIPGFHNARPLPNDSVTSFKQHRKYMQYVV
jgi:hypothetical protein